MEIRTFRQDDIGDIVDLWNASLQEHQPDNSWYVEEMSLSEGRLERTASNPNFDPEGAFVACEGRRMIGFGLGIVKRAKSYEEEDLDDLPGYLEGLVVRPAFRGKGTGAQLLQRIESYVRACGKDAIQTSRYRSAIAGISVIPDTPDAEFLLKRGFRSESCEMKLRLRFRDFSLRDEIVEARERLKRGGIEVTYYEDRYRDSFSGLMERYFQGWWYGSYKKNLDADEPMPVLIAADGDRVVGFIGFVVLRDNRRAGFSPGVDPAYRKRGIGKVLVNLWGEAVKGIGAEESIISTGTRNEPAQRIYFDMGYRKLGEFFARLAKDL